MEHGAKGDRTPDLVIANDALYQLSYAPHFAVDELAASEMVALSETPCTPLL